AFIDMSLTIGFQARPAIACCLNSLDCLMQRLVDVSSSDNCTALES
ncbi:hypothetical protein ADUPG1_004651, partial [Aduncisulcus paluster]